MDIKNLVIGALVGLVTLFGGLFVLSPEAPQQPPMSQPNLGALAGPDIPSPYLNWGNVRLWHYSDVMDSASTTCSIQSPAGTSTLKFAAAQVDVSSVGATLQYEWGKGTTAYATTTTLGLASLASGVQGTFFASTSPAAFTEDNVDHTLVFAPNTFLNLKIGSSTATTQSGACYAEFVELP